MKRIALGRGLESLIPPGEPLAQEKGIQEIEVADLKSNSDQPRKHFEEQKIRELAESIRNNGMIQPIVVRHTDDGYELIVGERRLRAARFLGLQKIPAIVYGEASRRETIELALVENIQRENLNPIEEASAYQVLLADHGLTQDDLATRVGRDRSSVANSLRLLSLPEPIKAMIIEGRLSAGAARVILAVPGEKEKIELAEKAVREGLSVRALEQLVYGAGKRAVRRPTTKSPQLLSLEEKLRGRFQTKVVINPRRKGGRIVIEYYNNDGLARILDELDLSER